MGFYLSAFADEAADSLDEQIAALKRNGIHFIEVRNIGKTGAERMTDAELYEISEKLSKEGIRVSALGSSLGKTKITDDFSASFDSLKRDCEVCRILKTDRIRMFSYFIPDNEPAEKYRDEVLKRLNKLSEYAASCGIKLYHENESKIYGNITERVLDILQNVSGINSVFDPSNFIMEDCDVGDAMKALLPLTGYLHIKDCTRDHSIVPSGYGDGKIGELVSKLYDTVSFDTYLTVEPHLKKFTAYSSIDTHELKNKFNFADNAESFDFAVASLKKVLTENGFKEGCDGSWTK